jgi:hypothetical protein
MSVQFCQFSLLPDFDLKLVFQIKIRQNEYTAKLKDMSFLRGGWWPNEAAPRVFRGPARPRLPRKLDI